MKLAQNRHRLFSVLTKRLNRDCPILVWLNIFVITEQIIATLFCLNVNYEKSNILARASLLSQ
jgi:hypothetical protein